MKNLCIILGCALLRCTAFAQQPDVAVGKATYELIHISDTTNRDKPYKETMTLLLGRNASVYRSISKQQQQDMLSKQIADQVKSAADPNHISFTITGGGAVINEEFYQFIKEQKLFTEELVVNYYLVEEPLPAIKWTILNDTMSFGALHAQKGTAKFKGRDYEAWFCNELPFRAGPWKLNGLPGLILEAFDLKKEVIFRFNGFEDISKDGQKIMMPADDIKTTPKDLSRLKAARAKDPAGFSKAAAGNTGKTRITGLPFASVDPSRISSINVVKSPMANSKVNNNPIELPEKK